MKVRLLQSSYFSFFSNFAKAKFVFAFVEANPEEKEKPVEPHRGLLPSPGLLLLIATLLLLGEMLWSDGMAAWRSWLVVFLARFEQSMYI